MNKKSKNKNKIRKITNQNNHTDNKKNFWLPTTPLPTRCTALREQRREVRLTIAPCPARCCRSASTAKRRSGVARRVCVCVCVLRRGGGPRRASFPFCLSLALTHRYACPSRFLPLASALDAHTIQLLDELVAHAHRSAARPDVAAGGFVCLFFFLFFSFFLSWRPRMCCVCSLLKCVGRTHANLGSLLWGGLSGKRKRVRVRLLDACDQSRQHSRRN